MVLFTTEARGSEAETHGVVMRESGAEAGGGSESWVSPSTVFAGRGDAGVAHGKMLAAQEVLDYVQDRKAEGFAAIHTMELTQGIFEAWFMHHNVYGMIVTGHETAIRRLESVQESTPVAMVRAKKNVVPK